ncbi:MAG: GntR family transcriptional regulator, partial [Oscillospiraceae bacterium]|nr:GntR family transcriptional regulator [Oscillospiraceae bacterium]
GFIESYTGRGSFVKKQNAEFLREEILKQTEALLDEACTKAKQCGMTLEELREMLEIIYEGEE